MPSVYSCKPGVAEDQTLEGSANGRGVCFLSCSGAVCLVSLLLPFIHSLIQYLLHSCFVQAGCWALEMQWTVCVEGPTPKQISTQVLAQGQLWRSSRCHESLCRRLWQSLVPCFSVTAGFWGLTAYVTVLWMSPIALLCPSLWNLNLSRWTLLWPESP